MVAGQGQGCRILPLAAGCPHIDSGLALLGAGGWRRLGILLTLSSHTLSTYLLQETVAKTHYSVDMLLAVVVTALVWHWRAGSYPAGATVAPRAPGSPPDPKPWRLVAFVFAVLAVVFMGVAGT